jgi:hypothetical protein
MNLRFFLVFPGKDLLQIRNLKELFCFLLSLFSCCRRDGGTKERGASKELGVRGRGSGGKG